MLAESGARKGDAPTELGGDLFWAQDFERGSAFDGAAGHTLDDAGGGLLSDGQRSRIAQGE